MSPRGRTPLDEYSQNTSFASPPAMWYAVNKRRHELDKARSYFYRLAIAVLLDNPGLGRAWLETAAPEKVRMVETGEGDMGEVWEPVDGTIETGQA